MYGAFLLRVWTRSLTTSNNYEEFNYSEEFDVNGMIRIYIMADTITSQILKLVAVRRFFV